jgi:hypothetical protein
MRLWKLIGYLVVTAVLVFPIVIASKSGGASAPPKEPEQAQQPEKPEKIEKSEKAEKPEKPEKLEKPEKGDKPEKAEKPEVSPSAPPMSVPQPVPQPPLPSSPLPLQLPPVPKVEPKASPEKTCPPAGSETKQPAPAKPDRQEAACQSVPVAPAQPQKPKD